MPIGYKVDCDYMDKCKYYLSLCETCENNKAIKEKDSYYKPIYRQVKKEGYATSNNAKK